MGGCENTYTSIITTRINISSGRSFSESDRHESDFRLAKNKLQLIPTDDRHGPSFEEFVQFIRQFEYLDNSLVAPRYGYGTLRLTRLNKMAPFLMGKLTYFHVHPQWTEYLGGFVPPVLALFAAISTVLGSMQVGLEAQDLDGGIVWPHFAVTCAWVSVCFLVLVVVLSLSFVVFFVSMMLKEIIYARSCLRANKNKTLKDSQAVI
jgi:hypothetical protein